MQIYIYVILLGALGFVSAGTKSKPHAHPSVLERFDGKHIPYSISTEQEAKLQAGHPVTINERTGSHGRGIVLQDIAAPPHVCLDRISDLARYPKMVPKVKKVAVYEENKFSNGTTQVGAEFEVGMAMISFSYYLLLSHEPRYQTFTWTLDYRYSSDFEDNVGHWQVMPHPTKEGWSRVLYSCAVQLPPWVPEFVLNFLTKSALVEATGWVRKEAERVMSSPEQYAMVAALPVPDVRACFLHDATTGQARYETHCADRAVGVAVAGEVLGGSAVPQQQEEQNVAKQEL